jgi:hypothetical protein
MAAVEVTISGILYDKVNKSSQNVVLIGEATLTGLGVGGGPMPPGPGRPEPPLGFWGGDAPWPGYATPPIYIPPLPPVDPPPEGPIEWHTAWSATTGWIVVGVPTGKHVTPSK